MLRKKPQNFNTSKSLLPFFFFAYHSSLKNQLLPFTFKYIQNQMPNHNSSELIISPFSQIFTTFYLIIVPTTFNNLFSQMITQFKRTLSKQISHAKASLPKKEIYSQEEISLLLSEFQKNLEGSLSAIIEANDQKLSESKNLLKKTNKAFNDYKIHSDQKQLEMTKQIDDMRRQLERSKKKVHELLKISQKHQEAFPLKQEKVSFDQGIQCRMRDQEMEKVLEYKEKQNISLKQRISDLQQQLSESKQDVEGANILIKELVRQLETNIADRETWNGTGSSNASELDSLDRIDDSDESFESDSKGVLSETEQQVSEVSVCRAGDIGQDCSTIDGSNTTNKDYALPEWLQFGQTTCKKVGFDEMEEEELKMWPELLWDQLSKYLWKAS